STDDTTPTLVGKGEPGDTIIVIDNGTPIGETEVDEDGNWSFTPDTPLGEGEHEFTVVERDPAGNESKPSDPHVVIVDKVAPTAEASITYMGKDSGIDNSDFLTNDGSAGRLLMGSLTEKLAAGEKVQVSVDGGKTWQDALVEDNGNWVFQDNTVHDASWTIQTRVVDEAGNCGDVVSQEVVLDTIAPLATPISISVVGDGKQIIAELPKNAQVGDWVVFVVGDCRFYVPVYQEFLDIGKTWNVVIPSNALEAIQSGEPIGAMFMDSAGNVSDITWMTSNIPTTEEVNIAGSGWMTDAHDTVSASAFFGTNGNDVFTLRDVEGLAGEGVFLNGNGGIDTLKLTGAGQTLDLGNTPFGLQMSSIEVFDITGTGNNTLKLSLGDVLEQGGKDLFIADGRTQVMVKGDAGDKVELSDLLPDGGDIGDWTQQSGNTTVGGIEYDVFYHSGLNAELLVQHGVETVLNNH
ncbi:MULTISPECIES: Ig-like domain-containing protein, partial [unclassified Paraburkholderia]|uniref:Ig-like domain-containing protein n=1 Tax=unclassified Paraburkholderia TaxID=2615204 RepID=UPI0017FA8533